MAVIKLVCQGCGAALDADDSSEVIECIYCHTRNAIQLQPDPPPPPKPSPQLRQAPPQLHVRPPVSNQAAGRLVRMILILAFVPFIIIGIVVFFVVSRVSEVAETALEPLAQISNTGGGAVAGQPTAKGRKFSWHGTRPFVHDVDGDGKQDIVGIIRTVPDSQLELVALSGDGWGELWKVRVGDPSTLAGRPIARILPEQGLVLYELGASLHAVELAGGGKRWVANLPDKVEAMAFDGGALWVRTIDEAGHSVSLADGSVTDADAKPKSSFEPLRSDEGYELIPRQRTLDVKSRQFDDLDVDVGFCAREDRPVLEARGFASVPCSHPAALAFATRRKGSPVPFLVAYDRATKGERWRKQLTEPGSLAGVDSGFGQPRVEFVDRSPDTDAIVSYVPKGQDNAHIRKISMRDGSTQWETVLDRRLTENVDGMIVGDRYVFVIYGGTKILDLDSGELVATVGGAW